MSYLEENPSSILGRGFLAAILLLLAVGFAGCGPVDTGPAGAETKKCAAGDSCVCEGTGSCTIDCQGANCNFTCEGTGSCQFNCPGGNCTSTCNGSGTCNTNCSGDDCTTDCNGTGTCNLSCSDSNACTMNCNGVGTCNKE